MAPAPGTRSCKVQEPWSKAIIQPFRAHSEPSADGAVDFVLVRLRCRILGFFFGAELVFENILPAATHKLTELPVCVIPCLRHVLLLPVHAGSGGPVLMCRSCQKMYLARSFQAARGDALIFAGTARRVHAVSVKQNRVLSSSSQLPLCSFEVIVEDLSLDPIRAEFEMYAAIARAVSCANGLHETVKDSKLHTACYCAPINPQKDVRIFLRADRCTRCVCD